MSDSSGPVTWRQFLTILTTTGITVVGLLFTATAWMWQLHESRPHPGALHREEYHADQDQLDRRLDRLEGKVDTILTRLNNGTL